MLASFLASLSPFLALSSFPNTDDLMTCRRDILPVIRRKQDKEGVHKSSTSVALVGKSTSTFSNASSSLANETARKASNANMLENLVDIREYDVPYVVRCCIDLDIRAGQYYEVTIGQDKNAKIEFLEEKTASTKANPRVLAFDIECTKAPLKFPDAENDEIFMISYMVDGQGYLIISREVVSQDIDDFEYTPKPSFPGPFKIFNER